MSAVPVIPPAPLKGQPSAGGDSKKKLYLVWWVVGTLVQILLTLPGVWKRIHWGALLLTTLGFVALIYSVETLALYLHWWIWDEKQLWGLKVGLVPLEEFLLYFLVVPSLATLQGLVEMGLEKFKVVN